MADLLNKLRMLDALPAKKPTAQTEPKREAEGCYRASAVTPLSVFCDRRHATSQVLESVFGCPFPHRVAPEDILFLDTETTGLSGGAGTVAFEIGLGYFTRNGFAVEQFLIRDYPEEPALLRGVCALMKRFSVLCTFNGRTFDAPLLKSRLIMNRMPYDCFPETHADVLFPARRIWKLRLKQCTLANLEARLLGVTREDDLPGALVPQTYFQYLKDGNFAPLEGVLEHNRQDVVSLAQLLFYLCMRVDCPESMDDNEDLLSLARAMEKRGLNQQAAKCYRLCANGETRAMAFAALAAGEKRHGNTEAAIKLYQAMLKRGDDTVAACEALAKLCEHQRGDAEQALHYTRQALLLMSEPKLHENEAVQTRRDALQYRYARLRRKLARCDGGFNANQSESEDK